MPPVCILEKEAAMRHKQEVIRYAPALEKAQAKARAEGEDVPLHLEPQETFLIRQPTFSEYQAYQAKLIAKGLIYPTDGQMLGEIIKLVKNGALVPDGINLEQLEAIIGNSDLLQQFPAMAEALNELEQDAIMLGGRYALLRAQRYSYSIEAPMLACRMFLAGVENSDINFVTKNGMVADDTLEQIPPELQMDIGWRALGLGKISKEDEKNL